MYVNVDSGLAATRQFVGLAFGGFLGAWGFMSVAVARAIARSGSCMNSGGGPFGFGHVFSREKVYEFWIFTFSPRV